MTQPLPVCPTCTRPFESVSDLPLTLIQNLLRTASDGFYWWAGQRVGVDRIVAGIGIVRLAANDVHEDRDSYGDSADTHVLVLELTDCGPGRWFRLTAVSDSYGGSVDWSTAIFTEVKPATKTVQVYAEV